MTLLGREGTFNQMVERAEQLDGLFAALSDPTRRALLARLRGGEAGVGELAEPFPVSLQAISKHLKVLEETGLVERRIEGRQHRLRLVPGALDPAGDWLEDQRRFWDERFDELERHLSAPKRRRGGLPKKDGR